MLTPICLPKEISRILMYLRPEDVAGPGAAEPRFSRLEGNSGAPC